LPTTSISTGAALFFRNTARAPKLATWVAQQRSQYRVQKEGEVKGATLLYPTVLHCKRPSSLLRPTRYGGMTADYSRHLLRSASPLERKRLDYLLRSILSSETTADYLLFLLRSSLSGGTTLQTTICSAPAHSILRNYSHSVWRDYS
jgi:hypothetical protein